MKKFQVIIVDDGGSHTLQISQKLMENAIQDAIYQLPSRNRYSIQSITATTVSTSI